MDGVTLTFENEALEAIAMQAIERNTGARGLRSIMESLMMSIMYEVPSRDDIAEIIIDKSCVVEKKLPLYVPKEKLTEASTPLIESNTDANE